MNGTFETVKGRHGDKLIYRDERVEEVVAALRKAREDAIALVAELQPELEKLEDETEVAYSKETKAYNMIDKADPETRDAAIKEYEQASEEATAIADKRDALDDVVEYLENVIDKYSN